MVLIPLVMSCGQLAENFVACEAVSVQTQGGGVRRQPARNAKAARYGARPRSVGKTTWRTRQ